MQKELRVDAAHKSLGRVASEIASLLQGKTSPRFQRTRPETVNIRVENVRLIRLTGKKQEQKTYHRFSGYPGGLKRFSLRDQPERVLKRAVIGMLPRTKHRGRMLKHLVIVP